MRDILDEMSMNGSGKDGQLAPVKEIEVTFAPDAYKVSGEAWEEFARPDSEEQDSAKEFVRVRTYGRLDIPAINLSMPIADEATLNTLRVSVGHYRPSAQMGEVGNFVLFGHRGFRTKQYLHHIGELRKGDEIIVISSKNAYIYEFDRSIDIKPSQLMEKITEPTDDKRIIIVSCTPLRDTKEIKQGDLRILVYGHLKETIPFENN